MNLRDELQRLNALALGDLQREFERVTGEPARSNNRVFLVKRLAWRLQAQAEGGLSERVRAKALAMARDQDLRVRPRADVHAAFADLPAATPKGRDSVLAVGTTLTRMYRGRRLVVNVTADGFEFEGERYTSLTAIAKVVTGSDWNGRLFFGVTQRSKPQ